MYLGITLEKKIFPDLILKISFIEPQPVLNLFSSTAFTYFGNNNSICNNNMHIALDGRREKQSGFIFTDLNCNTRDSKGMFLFGIERNFQSSGSN